MTASHQINEEALKKALGAAVLKMAAWVAAMLIAFGSWLVREIHALEIDASVSRGDVNVINQKINDLERRQQYTAGLVDRCCLRFNTPPSSFGPIDLGRVPFCTTGAEPEPETADATQ
jgi:hypothetical protein